MKLSFIELHASLFHGGKNFNAKVQAGSDVDLELVVKEIDSLRLPFVKFTYRGKPTLLQMTSINHITEEEGMIHRPTNISHPQDITKFQGAQVQTPMDHVFAGPDKATPATRRRIAKVQGE